MATLAFIELTWYLRPVIPAFVSMNQEAHSEISMGYIESLCTYIYISLYIHIYVYFNKWKQINKWRV